jgi:hypothetical protein
MKTKLFALLSLLTALGAFPAPAAQNVEFTGDTAAPEAPLSLWYRRPAAQWEEALPLGNGHIGAMVFGGVPTERIQFTEHTVWTGQPHSYAHPGAAKALPEMRRLLFEGRTLELQGLDKQKEAAQSEAALNGRTSLIHENPKTPAYLAPAFRRVGFCRASKGCWTTCWRISWRDGDEHEQTKRTLGRRDLSGPRMSGLAGLGRFTSMTLSFEHRV